MPRYKFQCSECEHVEIVFLQLSEVYEDCNKCNSKNTMQKQFDKFYSQTVKTKKEKVGNITKEYIEKNKQILKEQKKEARNSEYEPT